MVKANQPTLLDRCRRLPWHRVPVLDRTRDRGDGRVEVRTRKAVSVHHVGFPTPPRSCRSPARPATCTTIPAVHDRDVYAITSLTHAQAGPARLADLIRGHWAIEACTTSATPPSPRTASKPAPAAAQA